MAIKAVVMRCPLNSFAEDTFDDFDKGEFYHFKDSKGLLIAENKEIRDDGLWARVKVNKESKYYDDAMKLISEKRDKLAFSPMFSSPAIGGSELRQTNGKWYLNYLKGQGLGFGLTDVPINSDNQVNIAG